MKGKNNFKQQKIHSYPFSVGQHWLADKNGKYLTIAFCQIISRSVIRRLHCYAVCVIRTSQTLFKYTDSFRNEKPQLCVALFHATVDSALTFC